ncbi:MAG: hypothetical protein HKN77_02185 [Woeseiaceae bacterium]|nr:hypothetical protein [Woeseiaceae bacterium]
MSAFDRTIMIIDKDPVLSSHVKELIEFMDTPSVVAAVPDDWRERLGDKRLEALFVGPDLSENDVSRLMADLANLDPNVPVVMIHGDE